MKKKSVTLLLALSLIFSLLPAALAEENVTPTPPEWISEQYYLTFPDDKVYEPEYWVRIEALRESAQNGAVSIPEGNNDLFNNSSTGIWYEIGLVQLKYAENAGAETEEGRSAFREAGRCFNFAASSVNGVVVRMRLARDRAMMLYDYDHEANWAETLCPTLDALHLSAEEFFDAPYMELISKERRAKVIADIEAYYAWQKAGTEEIQVWLDGRQLKMDAIPEVLNGRTMVPIRAVAEALGADVEWVQDTQQINMTRAGVNVTMTLNNTTATVAGRAIEMDVAPYANNGRTLIPARYVAEFFDQKVVWDGEKRQVLIEEDKSVAEGSNLEQWAINMGLIYGFQHYGYIYGHPESYGEAIYFGMYDRSAKQIESLRASLAESWGVSGHDDVVSLVRRMTPHGHNDSFQAAAADANSLTDQEMAYLISISSTTDQYMWLYTKEISERWRDKGILAWDLSRMGAMVQWGYTAGYITYQEALELVEPAARLTQETFTSWDEFYLNYLDGYNWWARNNVYTYREEYEAALKETQENDPYGREMPEDIPYWVAFPRANYYQYTIKRTDDTLFQTGVIGLSEK